MDVNRRIHKTVLSLLLIGALLSAPTISLAGGGAGIGGEDPDGWARPGESHELGEGNAETGGGGVSPGTTNPLGVMEYLFEILVQMISQK